MMLKNWIWIEFKIIMKFPTAQHFHSCVRRGPPGRGGWGGGGSPSSACRRPSPPTEAPSSPNPCVAAELQHTADFLQPGYSLSSSEQRYGGERWITSIWLILTKKQFLENIFLHPPIPAHPTKMAAPEPHFYLPCSSALYLTWMLVEVDGKEQLREVDLDWRSSVRDLNTVCKRITL